MSTSELTTRPEPASELTPRSFPALEPVILERFVLGELLGLGGYGEVSRAVDPPKGAGLDPPQALDD